MGNLINTALGLLQGANKFAYGATPLGKAMSEVGIAAQQAGRSIRQAPNAVNIASQLGQTGLNTLNVLPQTIFHTAKQTPLNRIGMNTGMGRLDAPGVIGLAAGLLSPGGNASKVQKLNKLRLFNVHMPGRVLPKTNAQDAGDWGRWLQSQKIPHLIEQSKKQVNQFTKDKLGKFTGSKGTSGYK